MCSVFWPICPYKTEEVKANFVRACQIDKGLVTVRNMF